MPALDSLYRQNAVHWPAIYEARYRNLLHDPVGGDAKDAIIFAIGDTQRNGAGVDSTALKTYKFHVDGSVETFTWQTSAPYLYDTPFNLTLPSSWQGVIPILTVNGSDEEALGSDGAYFTHGDASNDEAFSIIAWIKMDASPAGNGTLLAKHGNGGDNREWAARINADGDATFSFCDDSTDTFPNVITDAGMSLNLWHQVVFTYDGTGGSSAMGGAEIYVDGALVATTETNDGSYTAMEDGSSVPSFLSRSGGVNHDGTIAGGPGGLIHVQCELTAAQVLNDYHIMLDVMGLN
jgi:hypothetical protein